MHNAKLGEDVEFTCDSTNKPLWYFNDGHLPGNAIRLNNNKLKITEVHRHNKGAYTCKGETENNLLFEAYGILRIFGEFNLSELMLYPLIHFSCSTYFKNEGIEN